MFARLASRVLAAVPVLFGAAVFTFLLTRVLPGDPAAFLASGPQAGPEEIAALRHQLGLDRSLPDQLWHYLGALARGDWGQSFLTGQPVLVDLVQRLPASVELASAGLLLAVLAGLPLGAAAALRPGSAIDHACRAVCTAGSCMPPFVTGLVLIAVFYVGLGWAAEPVGRLGFAAPPPTHTGLLLVDAAIAGDWEAWRSALARLVLPATSLALFSLAPLARIARASLLAVLSSDYLRTARALALPAPVLLGGYAFRNALLPVLNTLGLVFSYMLGASVVVEKLFAWPGIGSYAMDALLAADHAPVQGFVLSVAAVFVLVNLAVDLLAAALDPRARELA